MTISKTGFIFSGSDTTAGGGVSGGSTVAGTVNFAMAPASSVPAAYAGSPYLAGDCYGLWPDPSSNDQTFYFWQSVVNGINITQCWKTTNQGASWTVTAFPAQNVTGNETLRQNKNNQGGVDPVNSNVVYACGTTSLYRSMDGGATSSTVSAVGSATNSAQGVNALLFDTSLGTTTFSGQTVTAHIYVSITGSGIWHTLNGGSTWALIASSPTDVGKGWVGTDGWAYFLGFAGGSGITRIAPSTYALTTISGTSGFTSLALDAGDPSHAWGVVPGWSFYGFSGPINGATAPSLSTKAGTSHPVTSAPLCPWIKSTDLNINEIIWDPLVSTSTSTVTIGTGSKVFTGVGVGLNYVVGDALRAHQAGTVTNYVLGTVASYTAANGGTITLTVGSVSEGSVYLGASTGGSGSASSWVITKERVWIAQGSGLDYMDAPVFGGAISVIDQSGGIESLSGCGVLWPPTNFLLGLASDFPYHPFDVNPIGTTGLTYSANPAGGIEDGNSACWVWNSPSVLMGISVNFAGKSLDGGKTWTAFAATFGPYGHIAAATTSNIVVCNWNASGQIKYSNDGGAINAIGTGGPTSVPGSPYQTGVRPLCTDDNGTYYLIGNNSPVACFKSTNGGATFTQQGTLGTSTFSPQLRAVPGYPGHLLQCDGWQYGSNSSLAAAKASHPVSASQLRFCSDGGVTWAAFPNVSEAIAVSVGKAKPGGNGYPSIFLIGWVSSVFGYWRADNFNPSNVAATTWNFLGDYVAGRTDLPVDVAGCMDVYDWCAGAYLSGSGCVVRCYPGTWT